MSDLTAVEVELKHIREDLVEIKEQMRTSPVTYVTRAEWQLRNQHVDDRIASVWAELKQKRVPWPSVGALIAAGLAVVISIAEKL